MRAGQYNKRIIIQKQVDTVASGETIPIWQTVYIIKAAVEPLKGREYFQAAENHSENTLKIRFWYRPGITSDMRVIYNNRILYIQGDPIDPEESHRELQLMCIENKLAGPGE